MLEEELAAAVVRLLEVRPDLNWHRCRDSRHCSGSRGWPDLAIVGRRGFILRELKGEDTRARRYQLDYGEALIAAGVSWSIWRPDDLRSGRIADEVDHLR